MAIQRTFSIIKPDAVEKNTIGGIVALIEGAGLKVKAMRMLHLSRPQLAQGFQAADPGQPLVDHQAGVTRWHLAQQQGLARLIGADVEPLQVEREGQGRAHSGVVIDDEHNRAGGDLQHPTMVPPARSRRLDLAQGNSETG